MDRRSRVYAVLAAVVCACPFAASGDAMSSVPADVETVPEGAPLWTAATGPVSRTAEVSAVRDVSGDGVSEILLAEHGLRGSIDVALVDGDSGRELWRRRFVDPPYAPAVWFGVEPGPGVLVAHGDAISLVDATTGGIVRRIGLRAPIGDLAVARLDDDGATDVVYSAGVERDDVLVALSGRDFSELWTVAAEEDGSRFGNGFTRLTVLDLDHDGADEVLVCENMRSVLAVSARGHLVWKAELGERTRYVPAGAVSGPPVLGDFLGGGLEQLAIGLWAGTLVVVDPRDGEVVSRRLFGVDSDARSRIGGNRRLPRFLRAIIAETGEPINRLLVVELDGLSGEEVVFGCSDETVYAYSPRSDRVLWARDSRGQVYRRPVAVDVSGDGVPDILAWDEKGVYLIDGRDGSALGGFPPGESLADATLADLDHDGTVELIEVRRDGSVRAFVTGLACARASGAAGCGE